MIILFHIVYYYTNYICIISHVVLSKSMTRVCVLLDVERPRGTSKRASSQ